MGKNNSEPFPLQYIKGVGPRKAEILASEGLLTPKDLLYYFPRAYIDRTSASSLSELTIQLKQDTIFNENFSTKKISLFNEVTVVGKIHSKKENHFGRGRSMLTLVLTDGSSGVANIVFWNYIDYFSKIYHEGELLSVSGKVELDKYSKLIFNHPEIEKLDEEDESEFKKGSILPVYRLSEKMKNVGLNNRQLRKIISEIIPVEVKSMKEVIPDIILNHYNFPEIQNAVQNLHFPKSRLDIDISLKRMKFQEMFIFEIYLALRHNGIKINEKGLTFQLKSQLARNLVNFLPFQLTSDQKKVINEIAQDMKSGKPMNRLLQGDVGSGKTIVAILCMLIAIDNGCQVAFMAPTEILAEQHFITLSRLLKSTDLIITQLVGGQNKRARKEILEKIIEGKSNIVVGTHAMFESKVEYKKLGMIIIDEQHRFGVAQRSELKKLATNSLGDNISPHILVMSATPIPRTLSMTVYGDLDVSVIREMPKDRKPVKTKVVFESQLQDVFDFINKEVSKGRQAYIVYPLVEKSEKLELKSAVEHFEMLSTQVFPGLKCGLLHGQLFGYEKDDTMKAFLNKEYDILIATTVIEVGIDVPNATVMLIENAERFGLSQLHQLRGRVGRGQEQSYCMLATKDHFRYLLNKKGIKEEERKASIIRLKTMEETTDGFKIAEVDLSLRGPGDILGTRQSGLPGFKFIDLVNDGDIITEARKEAFNIIENDPQLRKQENLPIRTEFLRQYSLGETYFDIA